MFALFTILQSGYMEMLRNMTELMHVLSCTMSLKKSKLKKECMETQI